MKPALDALIKQLPREIFNRSKDFVAFAPATGGDLRLPATARPRVTQGAPLRKAGFVFKKDQSLATLSRPYNRRPLLLQPGEALGRVEMIRHKAGLLKRKSQVVEQGTDIMAVVEHTELAPDQHPDADRVPTRGLQAHHLRPRLDQLYQAFLLPGGQLRSAPTAMARDQAVHATQQQGLLPTIDTGGAEAPALSQHRHGHVVHQEVDQHRGPPHPAHIIALIGVLQPAVEICDGGATELYPDAHECILRWGYVVSGL